MTSQNHGIVNEICCNYSYPEAAEVEQEEADRLAKVKKAANVASATKDLFNFNNLKSGFKALFKKQSGRPVILLLILAFGMEYIVFKGRLIFRHFSKNHKEND